MRPAPAGLRANHHQDGEQMRGQADRAAGRGS